MVRHERLHVSQCALEVTLEEVRAEIARDRIPSGMIKK